MTDQSQIRNSRKGPGSQIAAALGAFLFHGTAIVLVYFAALWLFMGFDRIGMVIHYLRAPDFFDTSIPYIAILFVMAGLFWGLVYGTFLSVARRKTRPRAITAARGTVITETLIVLPLMLLLIMGFAQFAVNTTTKVLANLAAFESARAVWLWYPEMNRFAPGAVPSDRVVDEARVTDMARIQAAAVLTPVAHSFGSWYEADTTPQMRQMRGALVASQMDLGFQNAGQVGMERADDVSTLGYNIYKDRGLSFSGAFDVASYPVRSALKFSGAYLSTEVEIISGEVDPNTNLPIIGARTTYRHYQAFPLVDKLFGDFGYVGDRSGYYMEFGMTYTLIEQRTPHPGFPQ